MYMYTATANILSVKVSNACFTFSVEERRKAQLAATVDLLAEADDETEPAEWTIEVKLDDVHEKGAPGIFAFSPQVQKRVYIDNIKLSAAK